PSTLSERRNLSRRGPVSLSELLPAASGGGANVQAGGPSIPAPHCGGGAPDATEGRLLQLIVARCHANCRLWAGGRADDRSATRPANLTDLGNVLETSAMRQQYSDDWLKLAQVDGKQVSIFIKSAVKGLIWYDPKALGQAGYDVPKTWDELMATSRRIADAGNTPWCIGMEAGAASGWPGTDWLENIVLRQ